MAALWRPLLVATTLGVTLLGTGCGQREQAAGEQACAAEMSAAQPEIRRGLVLEGDVPDGRYFHMNHNTSGHSATIIEPGDDRTAEEVFMDGCVAGRLNPD